MNVDNNMNSLSGNQIQFLREKLQKEVKLYIELDDKIKALNKAAKDYAKKVEKEKLDKLNQIAKDNKTKKNENVKNKFKKDIKDNTLD